MTTAAPIVFGNFALHENVSYVEQFVNLGVSGSIPQFSTLTFAVATVTMPWAGTLTANLYHTGNWSADGLCGMATSPAGSPPTNWYGGSLIEYTVMGATWSNACYLAQWRDLAKGTVVNLSVTIRCTLGNRNWECMGFVGSLRMHQV